MSALQEQFVTEARELIRQATDDLIVLERDGASPERIDRVFRAFHTLKGSAGVVGLPAMRSWPFCVLGKAMTSRMLVVPQSSAQIRSRPKAMPPCGGAP